MVDKDNTPSPVGDVDIDIRKGLTEQGDAYRSGEECDADRVYESGGEEAGSKIESVGLRKLQRC